MTAPGSAASVVDPWAPLRQARALARVGALRQLVPGWLVEAVVVERDAPDEVSPAQEARQLPASGQGQEVWPSHGSFVGGLGSARSPAGLPLGPPPARCRQSYRHRRTPSGGPWACQAPERQLCAGKSPW